MTISKIKKMGELAIYLKTAAETFSQVHYKELRQYLQARYEYYVMDSWFSHHPGWSIVDENSACEMFLFRNWSFRKKANENATQFSALAANILNNYEDCDEVFLTEEVASEIMKITERVYDFSRRVLCRYHLFIFLLRTKHVKEDSFLRCMNMIDGSKAADIYMLIPHKDLAATPESMFLHELGHCVNIYVTGNPDVAPTDFSLLLDFLGIDETVCNTSEFCAHFFAMSLLVEPELTHADPFHFVPLRDKQLFRTYFQRKINPPEETFE